MGRPQSVIHILNAPNLDRTYQHTIYWDKSTQTAADQEEYFTSRAAQTRVAYSYIRRSWALKVDGTMDEADKQGWNYLCFRNTPNGKMYYYFINSIEYENENCVILNIEMDVIQTWFFELQLLPSFVERETVANDAIGLHTLDEGLETGELVTRHHETMEIGTGDMSILIMQTTGTGYGIKHGGVYSGLAVQAVSADDIGVLNRYIASLDDAGTTDMIVAMWMYPTDLIDTFDDGGASADDYPKPVTGLKVRPTVVLNPAVSVYAANGYKPVKNNKLYTFPYQMLYITNNAGASASYRLERFIAGDKDSSGRWYKPEFEMFGAISPAAAVKIAPRHYEDVETMYDFGLTSAEYPSCAWDCDSYKIWLAQNQNQIKHATNQATLKMIGGAATIAGSAITGNITGAAAGVGMLYAGATQIQAQIAQQRDLDVQPAQSRGNHSASINFSCDRAAFEVYWKQLAPEYANMIDDYFSMYGYKVNCVKVPTLNNRKWYTYVKTKGCNIDGNMPNDILVKIKEIFDNGVTFWKSDCVIIGNYNLMADNTPNG